MKHNNVLKSFDVLTRMLRIIVGPHRFATFDYYLSEKQSIRGVRIQTVATLAADGSHIADSPRSGDCQ